MSDDADEQDTAGQDQDEHRGFPWRFPLKFGDPESDTTTTEETA